MAGLDILLLLMVLCLSFSSTGYWQWARRWLHVKRPGLAPYIQLIVLFSAFSYASQYGFVSKYMHLILQNKLEGSKLYIMPCLVKRF